MTPKGEGGGGGGAPLPSPGGVPLPLRRVHMTVHCSINHSYWPGKEGHLYKPRRLEPKERVARMRRMAEMNIPPGVSSMKHSCQPISQYHPSCHPKPAHTCSVHQSDALAGAVPGLNTQSIHHSYPHLSAHADPSSHRHSVAHPMRRGSGLHVLHQEQDDISLQVHLQHVSLLVSEPQLRQTEEYICLNMYDFRRLSWKLQASLQFPPALMQGLNWCETDSHPLVCFLRHVLGSIHALCHLDVTAWLAA